MRIILFYLLLLLPFADVFSAAPKNIIYMIGDGMGLAQIGAAMLAKGGKLNVERCTVSGVVKTQSADNYITDSAAGGTALACGVKTKNGMVGMNVDTLCEQSILVSAAYSGKSTGIVVTSSVTHATPASFVAHQDSRLKDEDIAIDYTVAPIDLFIGGGRKFFEKRQDGQNLVSELKNKGFKVVSGLSEIKGNDGKVAGLVAEDHLSSVIGGRGNYLEEAVRIAIDVLSKDEDGFFLMVEGSQIDWGGHNNDAMFVVSEMLDFDNAIGAALDFAEKDGNTLVVVTADHETGGMSLHGGVEGKPETVVAKFSTTGHTGALVPVFAYGPGADLFFSVMDNTEIPQKIKSAAGLK